MARYMHASHFLILLFVVTVLWWCSTLCVSVYASGVVAAEIEQGKLSVDLYELKKEITNIKNPSGTADTSKKITFCQIRSHFFLFAAKGNVMVAITEAEYKENSGNAICTGGDKKVDFVAKFIKADSLKSDNIKDTAESWTTQLVTEKDDRKKTVSATAVFAVNADKDKINIFLVNIKDSGQEWEFKHVEGTINNEQQDRPITWGKTELINLNGLDDGQDSQTKLKQYKISSFVAECSAFFTKNKKLCLL